MEYLLNESPTFSSAKDLAYYELKKRILELDLYPGELIKEEELAEKLDVSRTPLREALSRLQYENLVKKQLNGRLKVAPVTVKEAKEIFQLRALLESIVVGEATENVSDKDIETLQIIIVAIQQMYRDQNIERVLYYGERFHLYIYEMSQNEIVKNILLQLNNHIRRYRSLVPSRKEKLLRDEGEEHRLIFECIKNKERKKAELMMKKHIEDSMQVAIDTINKFNEVSENIIK